MAVKPWEADRVVDAQLASELIAEHFFAPARVEPLGEGWDNTVFLADGAWVFRFPRRQIAVPLLENELRLLPSLAPLLPLPAPIPELSAASGGERFPWPFAGHRFLPGRTADAAAPSGKERMRAAPLLGDFLRKLHAAPSEKAPPDLFSRADPAHIRKQLRERLPLLGLAPPPWFDEPVSAPSLTVLVHGDLHARQLLFDRGAISGVIDWGDAHRGHPALDLSIAHSFLPRESHAEFRAAYGPIDEQSWRLARLRALHLCAALAVYARDTGDEALQREARSGIERASTGGSA